MSKPNISEYRRPATLEEAWQHIESADPAVRLLSGGADLTIHAPPEVTTLVDIGPLLDDTIGERSDGSVHIGAMATLTDVMDHAGLAEHAGGVIPEMMVHVGNPLLRNFSTIGGHVARGKLSDVVPVFLALDVEVIFYDGETKSATLSDYYEGGHQTAPHIVTSLRVPALPPRSAAAFARFARTAFDFPILNAACRVDQDGPDVKQARIVCGATPSRAQRAYGAEELVLERGLSPSSIDEASKMARSEIHTRSGWVATAEYRSQLVEVLTRRCLLAVAERLESS